MSMNQTLRDLQLRVLKQNAAHVEAIEDLADIFREQVIVPVCATKHLRYVGGPVPYFYNSEAYYSAATDYPGFLRPIFAALGTRVTPTQKFGFFVKDAGQ